MTVAIFPGRDYDADMQRVADKVRRNTHLVVAKGPFGETHCEHARPHAEAVEYAGAWARTLGPGWTVKAVPVRKAAR
jgi:hypothetical protein